MVISVIIQSQVHVHVTYTIDTCTACMQFNQKLEAWYLFLSQMKKQVLEMHTAQKVCHTRGPTDKSNCCIWNEPLHCTSLLCCKRQLCYISRDVYYLALENCFAVSGIMFYLTLLYLTKLWWHKGFLLWPNISFAISATSLYPTVLNMASAVYATFILDLVVSIMSTTHHHA